MNNEEKILDLLNSISSSIEELKQEIKRIEIKIDNVQAHFDARFNNLDTSIKNINNRDLHMLDMILENRQSA